MLMNLMKNGLSSKSILKGMVDIRSMRVGRHGGHMAILRGNNTTQVAMNVWEMPSKLEKTGKSPWGFEMQVA